jgi:hypothetical protein
VFACEQIRQEDHSLIRHKIIAYFKGTDAEPNLDEVAKRLGVNRSALISLLHGESPLDDLNGLTLKEAKGALKQFEGMALFAPSLEKAITEFNESRDQIREIEKLARGGGPPRGK